MNVKGKWMNIWKENENRTDECGKRMKIELMKLRENEWTYGKRKKIELMNVDENNDIIIIIICKHSFN